MLRGMSKGVFAALGARAPHVNDVGVCGDVLELAWLDLIGRVMGSPIQRRSNVGGGLPPMAVSGLTSFLGWVEYISIVAVTAAMGSALTAGHFGKAPK